MKRRFYYLISLAMLLAVGCTSEKGQSEQSADAVADTVDAVANAPADSVAEVQHNVLTAVGTAVGGAMNSIMIEDASGETLDFEYSQLSRDSIDAWEEGSKVEIRYTRGSDGDVVQSVRVVR
ncbi:MAG: hypothetical protein ACI30R_01185 [Sodaliphilus sp.]